MTRLLALLRAAERRHLTKSRANARAGLAAMGADCPDDGEGYALPFNCADHADWDKWELELAMGRHPSSGGLW